jgi:hypothetical protein
MASSGRHVVRLAGVMVLLVSLVAACSSAATRKADAIAREDLGRIHAADLGRVLGQGSYGSAGLSGSRPTAFIAVRTEIAIDEVLATIGDRMQQNGVTPFGRCQPYVGCWWERRFDHTLVRAYAVIKTGGQPWGEDSTAHGTVAPGNRVLQVGMIVGG